jgi:hypothetical protein
MEKLSRFGRHGGLGRLARLLPRGRCQYVAASSRLRLDGNLTSASGLRHPLFTLTVHLYTAILLPLLHSLWLLTGTGNANFFYAATMVYGLNASLAVVDVLGAGLRSAVKRKVSEQILDDVSGPDGRWDREAMDKQWDAKGWAVVQFTSAGK